MSNKDSINRVKRDILTAKELADIVQSVDKNLKLEDYPNLKSFVESNKHSYHYLSNISSKEEFELRHNKQRDVERIYVAIRRKERLNKRFKIASIAGSVAAAMIAVTLLIYYPLKSRDEVVYNIEPAPIVASNIVKPTIVTGSGEAVSLDSEITEQKGGFTVSNEGVIAYNTNKQKKVEYNELIIPTQQSYTLVLSDGSEVIVNGGSKLRYPVSFSGDTRDVTLTGEAYFRVKKSDVPFVVNSMGNLIKVYGTEFNINNKSSVTETVLVSGSVGVKSSTSVEQLLKPNQMAKIGVDGELNIEEVNIKNYVSWIDNRFSFDEESLDRILTSISEWYGVEFYSEKNFADINMSIFISRDKSIDAILDAISIIGEVKFIRTEGGNYRME